VALWRPFSVCRGRRQRNFFVQRLGQLRTADANAFLLFDLGAQPADRPVAPVGHRRFQQRRGHTQRRFTFHRGRAGRHAGLQRLGTVAHKVAAPQPDRVFSHTKRLGDARAGPAGQRQQHGTRPIRLAAISRAGKRLQRRMLLLTCHQWRSSAHAHHPRIGADRESTRQPLVNHAEAA